jgi:two-component system response regulator HydG
MPKILLVDDDPQSLESTRKILEFAQFEVVTATDGQSALEQVRPTPGKSNSNFDLVVTDVRMPRLGGLEFLRALSLCGETMPVILMTAFGRVEDAVWAMKLGAVDFLTKPFKRQALLASIESALKRSRFRNSETNSGTTPVGSGTGSSLLIGRSSASLALKELIHKVAPAPVSVLLTGESGTGKELVARCLHQQSPRSKGQFVALNCAAIPEHLIESELFGFEKGAFTGATGSKEGLFEVAHDGTLLLDEIGDMPLALQAKLLRVLQENEVRRVGSTLSKKIDVRVIAATHKDLKQGVKEGTFRQDLLYRLEVVEMHIVPLRERVEDIPELAYHFLKQASRRHSKEVQGISEEAMEVLLAHSWPGNVRELSNVIERAIVFVSGNFITVEDLPAHLISRVSDSHPDLRVHFASTISVPLGTSLRDVEDLLIRKTLEATDGDKNMTAKLLGINSRTIYRKLDKKLDKEIEADPN